jgi:EAL domain-containing protein (putative c-di-GMP-specific phosphodiesterase class I)/CheY-like chemotaxis protein
VLVVEDSPVQRAHAVAMVRTLGAGTVLEAGHGLAALEMLGGEAAVDLVVCDLEMPFMDGVAFIGEMASRGFRPELVILSSVETGILRSVRLMATTFGLRVLGYIEKPLAMGTLLETLGRSAAGKPGPAAVPALEILTAERIREGLRDGEFLCFFQPQLTFNGALLKGVEALIRWRHPVHGLLGPGAFLPQVEQDAALMASMTLYVLDYVAWQWKDWNAKGLKPVVSVNLSALSVSAPGFADRLLEKLDQLGLPPSHLVFELTESASVSNLGHTLANLIRLKMRGYNLSIDDFGTGFATFEQLERIPFGELKIDQSITRELAASARHAALAQNLIRMAGDLGLITVAEGIETQAAWDALKAMGCNRGQGYFLGRPMPGDQLGEWALADRTHLR